MFLGDKHLYQIIILLAQVLNWFLQFSPCRKQSDGVMGSCSVGYYHRLFILILRVKLNNGHFWERNTFFIFLLGIEKIWFVIFSAPSLLAVYFYWHWLLFFLLGHWLIILVRICFLNSFCDWLLSSKAFFRAIVCFWDSLIQRMGDFMIPRTMVRILLLNVFILFCLQIFPQVLLLLTLIFWHFPQTRF